MTPIRWKRFYPGGAQEEYVLKQYDPPGYPVVEIATWTPDHGYVGDITVCAECGCVEEAGGHHRDGCCAVTLSPNYWGQNAVGNKHTFFVLEGAKNDEATRGFYNEFLHPRLEPHRKVFEVIGDKTKCQPTEGQLSGLGFSSTKKETFLVRAYQGKKQRVFQVRVGG